MKLRRMRTVIIFFIHRSNLAQTNDNVPVSSSHTVRPYSLTRDHNMKQASPWFSMYLTTVVIFCKGRPLLGELSANMANAMHAFTHRRQ